MASKIEIIIRKIIPIFILGILIASCTVRLIAPYDEVTDKRVSELQENILLTFKKWQREVPTFVDASSFYDQTEVALEILIERNKAIEKSDIIVSALDKTLENIVIVKNAHENGILNAAFLEEIYPDINKQFNAIQKFQMALKRSEETQK